MKYNPKTQVGNTTFDILHLFGEKQINAIQERLSRVTHLGFVTVNYKGESLTEHTHFCNFCQCFRSDPVLRQNCNASDAMSSIQSAITGKPLIYQCPCGLTEIAIPIVINGSYLGGFLCGQALCQNPPDNILRMNPASDPEQFNAALDTFGHLRKELPVLSYEEFRDIAELVSMIITMLCENKLQQLENEANLKSQISRIDFLQTQIFQLARLYYQMDYQALMHYVPTMVEEMCQFYNDDLTRFSDALVYLINNFLQTSIYEEDIISEIQNAHPVPVGTALKPPLVTCWIMQILDSATQKLAEYHYPILHDIFLHINSSLEGRIQLTEITKKCNISQAYLSKLFRQCFHLSVNDYIHLKKILATKSILAMPGVSLTDVAFQFGYNDYSHFSKIFKKYEGISPREYRTNITNS